ncbi:MAG: translation initiation factor IF-2 [Planctomycetes bacterium]|nr:translation initiation factor IF-2 [Planctomycetota bacterium]
MSHKMTVADLARELKIEPDALVAKAKAKGIVIRSKVMPLADRDIAAVREIFAPKPKPAAFMTARPAPKPVVAAGPVAVAPPTPAGPIAVAPPAAPAAASPTAPVAAAPAAPAVPTGPKPIMSGPPVAVLPAAPVPAVIFPVPGAPPPAPKPRLAPRKPTVKPEAQKPKAVVEPPKPKVVFESTPAEVIGAEKAHALDLSGQTAEEAKNLRILRPTEIDQLARTTPTGGGSAGMHGKRRIDFKHKGFGAGSPGELLQDRIRHRKPRAGARPVVGKPAAPAERRVEITLPITVKELSHRLGIRAPLLLARLMDQNIVATINSSLGEEACIAIGLAFDKEIVFAKARTAESAFLDGVAAAEARTENLVLRAPVVTLMGHVDHGKTSILDWIRKSKIAASEAGGITQHIRAWKIETHGKPVVFLDTPGHEAFTAMRARGANVTDLVLLVVAADDGVMPQTEEAINHAKAAEVKIVVAVNKIDKPQANPHRVMLQLSQHNLIPEKWGGNTVFAEVSAITGQGMPELLELLALEAELLELKANPKLPAQGTVLEARVAEGKGVTATVLIQNGTLHRGDVVLCGRAHGRVRALINDVGRNEDEAGPSTPVGLLGLSELPEAGDTLHVVRDLSLAKEISEARSDRSKAAAAAERQQVTLETLFHQIEKGKLRGVNIVLKADVKGSVEVLRERLRGLSTDEVSVNVIHAAVGAINESDVILAYASKAIILGFHVDPEDNARALAKDKGVDIRRYEVIYHVEEDMKAALEGLLEPERIEVVLGHLRVKEIFKSSKFGNIAGCVVNDGKIERSAMVRVIRDRAVIHDAKVESLRRFKDDVKEVAEGFECGLRVAGFDDVRTTDILEAYAVQHVARKLERRAAKGAAGRAGEGGVGASSAATPA